MRVAVVNLTGGGFSGGYRKYLDTLVPLLSEDRRVSALEVYGPRSSRHDIVGLDPHVVFIPTARWANFGELPVVPMVRNMEPLSVPFGGNSLVECCKNLARARAARVACKHGRRIIAVSEFVRDYLVDHWEIDGAKIGVVEHGVEMPKSDAHIVRPASLPADLSPSFVFTAGSLRPARGLEDVMRALEVLRDLAPRVVVAGTATPGNRGYERRMRRLALECRVDARIIWAGQLPTAEMAWCYRNCASFLMTSRAEACPNVLLEAMSHGCLCVTVERSPMTTILGPAGLYYEPGNAVSLAERLRDSSKMAEAVRTELRDSTVQRAGTFDWRRTAELTVTELELATQ